MSEYQTMMHAFRALGSVSRAEALHRHGLTTDHRSFPADGYCAECACDLVSIIGSNAVASGRTPTECPNCGAPL